MIFDGGIQGLAVGLDMNCVRFYVYIIIYELMNAVSVKSILDRLRRRIKVWLFSNTAISYAQSHVLVGEIRRGGMIRLHALEL